MLSHCLFQKMSLPRGSSLSVACGLSHGSTSASKAMMSWAIGGISAENSGCVFWSVCVWSVCIDVNFLVSISFAIFDFIQLFKNAGGTGVTLVPVPTKTARSHSDIKGRRPFDVPAVVYPFGFESHGMGLSREPQQQQQQFSSTRLPQSGIQYIYYYSISLTWHRAKPRTLWRQFIYLGSILFRRHGRGLSREPYRDNSFMWGLCLRYSILGSFGTCFWSWLTLSEFLHTHRIPLRGDLP